MKKPISATVIIPTYNRKRLLYQTLTSLMKQTCPTDRFEVIVVDDGSTDGTLEITKESLPFTFRYFRQTNQGDAAARNLGANHSNADLLIFLDDDIIVGPNYVEDILQAHEIRDNRIVVGTEFLWLEDSNPLSQVSGFPICPDGEELIEIPFADVCSNNMSVRKKAYFTLGLMQSLDFPGSSIWCDVDFTFRAHRHGFKFLRSTKAICWHRDYVVRSLDNQKTRMGEAAYRSVKLFQKYPDLISYLPMFSDKTPIKVRRDPFALIIRKLLRRMASSKSVLWVIERLAESLQKWFPTSSMLIKLHQWIIGGYIFRGYRQGLREVGFGNEHV